MKNKFIKISVCTLALSLLLGSCTDDILDEQSRTVYTPDYFKTEAGVIGGLTGMYAHLRYMYGQAYYYNATLTGTDEATWGQSADGNFKDADLSGVGNLNSSSSRSDVLWNTAFSNINAANGIIENASAVGISEALVSEARFFRAFDYFLLVQTFGGVPLDLGSGELKFNVSQNRTSVRNTVPEVYTKVIFPDLVTAVANLPDAGRVTGGATKTVARLHLAKAYLTYGWWLENPNNIPTYPETPRTDPDGHNAQWYFQKAYDIAIEGIDNPGPFALQPTFYDVNVATNDRNNEILLMADHTESSEIFNGGSLTFGSGGAPDNFAGWMLTWNYTSLVSGTTPAWTAKVSSVQREAAQPYGRPWVRMAPPQGVFNNTFADKVNDSRYDGTFTTVYRGNWDKTTLIGTNPVLYGANGIAVEPGDAIFSFLNEEPSQPIDFSNTTYNSGIGAGVLPGRADFVLPPSRISRRVYPGLWKLGPYRTDNAGGLGQPNAGSTRPFNVAKFSELYLVAAEAAVKGAATQPGKSARDLVNVLRARAGKWRYSNADNAVFIQDNSAAAVAATPAVIDINYILAERSREYFGEGYRWFDLVRTQKWNELAGTYTICGPNLTDVTPQTFTRTIQPFHYLRPIPQGQLDAMDMPDADIEAYQNPGYE
ncbi:RagB/SusD family nutrient uptake outer membrane protein [Flavobacterium sp. RHBU_24]|uniref:RagB/SusD family nutrient uptake outer membrane protein n=1 Tax=Flavobacterium sp. RHBU_24 TaxID=3391185 RepID=UPI0039854715